MSRRTDAQIGRLVREALRGKRLRKRRQFRIPGYMEPDRYFLENNNDAAVALIEALLPKEKP